MIKILSIALVVFGFVGCAYNDPNVLIIKPYQSKVTTLTKGKSIKKVYLKSVIDLRNDPSILGSFEDGGKVYLVRTKTKIITWVYDALQRGLRDRGYVIVDNPTKGSLNLQVAILSLNAQYKEYQNKNNMFGNLFFQVGYKRGIHSQNENIKLSLSSRYSSLPSQSEYEGYIYKMLDETIGKIIEKTDSY